MPRSEKIASVVDEGDTIDQRSHGRKHLDAASTERCCELVFEPRCLGWPALEPPVKFNVSCCCLTLPLCSHLLVDVSA